MDATKPLIAGYSYRRLVRARDFAAANFAAPLSVARLAEEACLSPWHFHRQFTAVFGETPHAFLARLRLDRAKQLLAADDVSVTDACFETGYLSLGTFSSWFRDEMGMTPSAYRREVRRVFGTEAPWRFAYIPTCFLGFWRGG
ncbi:MAG: helix-turn-helix domain-containing protein [Bauldia sp.]